jgi:nicotinamidase-related amidase
VSDSTVALGARTGELALVAAGIDGFYGSPLDAILHRNERTHLLVAGLGLETAVHSTVRRANDRGYECLTVIDACLPHDTALVPASRSSIEMSGGIFGAVGASADVLAAYRSTLIDPISP